MQFITVEFVAAFYIGLDMEFIKKTVFDRSWFKKWYFEMYALKL